MNIFCIEPFKLQFEKLKKKNSYSTIEQDIIDYFFSADKSALLTGTRLNNSDTIPYIKKRLKGSGGYRLYYLVIVKDDNLYLMFVHPRTGSMGYDNISDELKAVLYKQVLDWMKINKLYLLTIGDKRILFTRP